MSSTCQRSPALAEVVSKASAARPFGQVQVSTGSVLMLPYLAKAALIFVVGHLAFVLAAVMLFGAR